MDDDLQLLADVFPDVAPPDEQAWQLVTERLAVASARSGRQGMSSGVHRRRRHLGWSAIAVAAAAAVITAVLLSIPTPGAPPAPRTTAPTPQLTQPGWQLVSTIDSAAFRPDSAAAFPDIITCPTDSICYVVTLSEVAEQGLQNGAGPTHDEVPKPISGEVTTDGGATWTALALPAGLFLNTGFSCPDATTCMVGAIPLSSLTGSTPGTQLLLTTTDGGTSWSEQVAPIPGDPGPDPTLLASGTSGRWSQLQCFDTSDCIAFGTTPYGLGEQGGPSTPVNQTVVMQTHDGGRHWATEELPWEATPSGGPAWSNEEPATFSCPTQQTCIGLATVLGTNTPSGQEVISTLQWRTDDGGTTWTNSWVTQPFLGEGWQPLTCTDTTHCLAVAAGSATMSIRAAADALLRTVDGGTQWQSVPLASSGVTSISSITCNAADDCWVTGHVHQGSATSAVILESTDGGTTWAAQTIPSDVHDVGDLACPSVTTCYAVAIGTGPQETTELLTYSAAGTTQ